MANPLLPTHVRNGHVRYRLLCDRTVIGALPDLPKEKMKTIIAAFLLFISSLCTSFSLSFLNEVVPRDQPLPDIVFQMIPIQEWAWPVSDLLVVLMASTCALSMLLHRYRWVVMRRVFLIASVLYYLRALAMLVTWIPLSDRSMGSKCITPLRLRSSGNHSDHHQSSIDVPWSMIGVRMIRYGFSMGFVGIEEENRVLCGDYIYSGHTLMYTLTTLTIGTYFPKTGFYGFLSRIYPVSMFCGMILVVISRLHYTIDVLIAYWMTKLTFWCYHALISLPRSNNRLSADTKVLQAESQFEFPPNDPDDVPCTVSENGSFERTQQTFNLFGSSILIDYFEKNIPAGTTIPPVVNWPCSRPGWVKDLVNGMN